VVGHRQQQLVRRGNGVETRTILAGSFSEKDEGGIREPYEITGAVWHNRQHIAFWLWLSIHRIKCRCDRTGSSPDAPPTESREARPVIYSSVHYYNHEIVHVLIFMFCCCFCLTLQLAFFWFVRLAIVNYGIMQLGAHPIIIRSNRRRTRMVNMDRITFPDGILKYIIDFAFYWIIWALSVGAWSLVWRVDAKTTRWTWKGFRLYWKEHGGFAFTDQLTFRWIITFDIMRPFNSQCIVSSIHFT
jgi:hypothetical protein